MASPDTLEKVRGIVSLLFNIPLEEVTAESSPETVEAWDSMGQLTLILELEQEFGVDMTHERVQQMKTVGSIADIIDGAVAA